MPLLSNKKKIEKAIDDYIKLTDHNYAILLNGDWGIGKTYFINDYIEEFKKRYSSDKVKKMKYISLNGLSTKEDIQTALIIPPKVAKTTKDIDIKIGTLNVTKITNTGIKLLHSIKDYSNHIFIFDDLERCKIDFIELWGFLSNLIEIQHAYIIIIAAEKEIEKKENYKKLKEKIIRFTYNLNTDSTKNIDKQLGEILNPDEITYCKKLILEYSIINFRIIFFAIDILKCVIGILRARLNDQTQEWYCNKCIKEIILFVIIISNEIKKGNIYNDNYEIIKSDLSLQSLETFLVINNNKYEEWQEKKIKEPYNKYFYFMYFKGSISLYDEYEFYSPIFEYMVTGICNEEEIVQIYTKRVNTRKENQENQENEENQKRKKLIVDCFAKRYNFKDEEYSNKINELLNYVENGNYPLHDCLSIAKNIFIVYKANEITKDIEEIIKSLKTGIEKQTKCDNEEMNNIVNYDILDEYLGDYQDRYNDIKNLAIEKKDSLKKDKNKIELNKLFEDINNNILTEDTSSILRSSTQIFMYIDIDKLVSMIKKWEVPQLSFLEQIISRRNLNLNGSFLTNMRKSFIDESVAIDKLISLLENNNNNDVGGENMSIRRKNIYNRIINILRKISESLKIIGRE